MPSAPASPAGRWPGDRLGRPESGPGSIARPGVRIAAIAIDFGISFVLYSLFFFGSSWASLVIFVLLQLAFLIPFGGSIGHLLMGIRLVNLQNRWAGVWRPIVRTLLLALLIPALIWNADQRGLHDVFAGTVLVRVR